MPTAQSVDSQESPDLRRHLSVLFPGYAGDRQNLLATLTEEELKRTFEKLALDLHPDRIPSPDPTIAQLHQDRFRRAQGAFQALREHVRRIAQSGPEHSADDCPDSGPDTRTPRIIAVGGAKGGVGKTTLTASLATALAMMGHRVVAVDMDLGGADLHLFFGIRRPERKLSRFLAGDSGDLAGLLQPTTIETLSVISGDSSFLGAANVKHETKQKLIRQLRRLPAHFIVLDLGGDTSYNTLDFFLLADQRLVITTADPASVLEGYNLIKVGLLRSLSYFVARERARAGLSPEVEDLLRRFLNGCSRPDGPSMSRFLAEISEFDPAVARAIQGVLANFRPKLVLNLSDASGGKEIIKRIREVCKEHLRIDVELCHLVPVDSQIPQATRRLSNVIGAGDGGAGSQAIWALASKLADPKHGLSPRVSGAADRKIPPGFAAVIGRRPVLKSRFFQPPWLFPLLPRVLGGRARLAQAAKQTFRAWFLGSGSGEGPYSLAITLEEMGRRIIEFPYTVSAFCSSAAEVEEAKEGAYPRVFLGELRPDTLKNYFLQGVGLSRGYCRVKDFIRERVTFVEGDECEEPPSGPGPDLVFANFAPETFALLCRGLLARRLRAHLKPGGLLIVPSWPRPDLPLPSFTQLDEGIFQRTT